MNSPSNKTINALSAMSNSSESQASLLPTKVSSNVPLNAQAGSGRIQADRKATPRWTSQPVLSWIESMAAATETLEAQQGKSQGTLSVSDVALSEPSMPLSPAGKTANSSAVARTGSQPLKGYLQSSLDQHNTSSFDMPEFWDIGFLSMNQEPESLQYVQRIASLAVQVESFPALANDSVLREKYRVVQERVEFFFRRITEQTDYANPEERRSALITLYEDTILKLKQIVEAVGGGKPVASGKTKSVQPPPTISATSSFEARTEPKKDLSKYMTAWLRDNWTNPYPDDDGLEQMAQECGTTATVVSNWLINARTRKWRPAIVKASEMNRPAGMLLEDSLRIFDGESIGSMLESFTEDDEGRSRKRIKRSQSFSPGMGI